MRIDYPLRGSSPDTWWRFLHDLNDLTPQSETDRRMIANAREMAEAHLDAADEDEPDETQDAAPRTAAQQHGFEKVKRKGKGKGGGQFAPGGGQPQPARLQPGRHEVSREHRIRQAVAKAAGVKVSKLAGMHPEERTAAVKQAFPQLATKRAAMETRNLQPAETRAFSGTQAEAGGEKLSKLESGSLGEKIAADFLRTLGLKEVGGLNVNRNNFPVDLITEQGVVEVKAGLATNSKSAQQWRSTIGQPGPTETEWLKTASPEEKAAWNSDKAKKILERKEAAAKQIEEETGRPLNRNMVGVIINPATKTADVYLFDGFHHRIGWNSDDAKQAFQGSFRYD